MDRRLCSSCLPFLALAVLLTTSSSRLGAQHRAVAQYRGDAQNSGVGDKETIRSLSGVRFSFETEGPIRGTPVRLDGVLFLGSSDGFVYALDAENGTELWRRDLGAGVVSSPAASGGTLFVSTRDQRLLALSTVDGSERWRLQMGPDLVEGYPHDRFWDFITSSPTLHGGRLYIGGGDGNLYSVDPETGRVLWRFDAGERIRTSPAVDDGKVVFGDVKGRVHAVAPQDGQLLWTFKTKGADSTFADRGNDQRAVITSPVIVGGRVIVGVRDGFVYSLDGATGEQQWSVDHGGSWILALAVRDGVVYVGSGSSAFIQALRIENGEELWRRSTAGGAYSLCVVGDQVIYQDVNGNVTAVESDNGGRVWQFPVPTLGRTFSAPLVANGIVYASSDEGVLHALARDNSGRTLPDNPIRLVYWKEAEGNFWFSSRVEERIRDQFRRSGYRVVGDSALQSQVAELSEGSSSSVIVFANNRIPAVVLGDTTENAPIRRYLDNGGKVVIMGANSLTALRDATTGRVNRIDFSGPLKVFGVRYGDRFSESTGHYRVTPTPAGEAIGLRGWWVGRWSVSPDQVTTVLAEDELGSADSWLKSYGGPEGTGLLQLSIAQDIPNAQLARLRAVIEYGVTW